MVATGIVVLIAAMSYPAGGAVSQALTETDKGRYSILSTPDGVIRLDSRGGSVSTCAKSESGWACFAIPDERAALDLEIGRLQKENESLREQLAQRAPGNTDQTSPNSAPPNSSPQKRDAPAADGGRKIEIPLPNDRDVDRVMSFLENAWRKLVDLAARMQRDASGKI